ncbi:hypothetical protein P692DRAFT_20839646 [Suillus brevipes Sb2]|nr:hypothetical protein P692DRAFT_20839646 [Suillus brevipes Sb2]
MPRLPKIILLDLASFKRHGIEHKRRGRKGDQRLKKLDLTLVLFLIAGRGAQVPVCELTLEGLAVNTRCGHAWSESIKEQLVTEKVDIFWKGIESGANKRCQMIVTFSEKKAKKSGFRIVHAEMRQPKSEGEDFTI